jgi:argininosuccinate lyase
MKEKLWGGRFEKATDEFAEGFHSSISFDSRLYRQDIAGSIAHAKMLGKRGIIPQSDADSIVCGLNAVLEDIESGRASFSVKDEDIHMNVERLLIEKIGDAGKRLHTGRSRNDQVATDFALHERRHRCYRRQAEGALHDHTDIADSGTEAIMPAYTHLQKAQPTTLAHWIMAYLKCSTVT